MKTVVAAGPAVDQGQSERVQDVTWGRSSQSHLRLEPVDRNGNLSTFFYFFIFFKLQEP